MVKALLLMLLAACVAAVNVPMSEYLLPHVPALLMGSLTFLGAALGTGVIFLIRVLKYKKNFKFLSGRDWLYVGAVNIFDTAANIMLFYGIMLLTGETASLLQTFEVVATALVAFSLFKEKLSWRLIIGIVVVVIASALLFFDPAEGYKFQPASLLIIGATICWGFDNNFAKKVSGKDPFEFSFFKCLMPGIIILIIAFATSQYQTSWGFAGLSLLDGFIAYGLSIALIMVSFRTLSASAGTAVYAMNPFIGAILSLIFFPKVPSWNFYVAIALMLLGEGVVYWAAKVEEKETKKVANEKANETIINKL
jgi:drug/metabolite transporter (DMT)-like permease